MSHANLALIHHSPHPFCSAGPSFATPARACTCALLEPSRSPCIRFRSVLAPSGASGDDFWRYLYTCRTTRLQRAPSRAVTLLRSLTFLRSTDNIKVSRPVRTQPSALTAAHLSPCAHSNVCCVHPKRPMHHSPHTLCPAGPSSVPPQHAHALLCPARALTFAVHRFQVRAGDFRCSRSHMLARFQWQHAQVV